MTEIVNWGAVIDESIQRLIEEDPIREDMFKATMSIEGQEGIVVNSVEFCGVGHVLVGLPVGGEHAVADLRFLSKLFYDESLDINAEMTIELLDREGKGRNTGLKVQGQIRGLEPPKFDCQSSLVSNFKIVIELDAPGSDDGDEDDLLF